ncbi:MAG: flavin reductase family protein [bacterium]|nr:flavin reductase family protein [bacterium]
MTQQTRAEIPSRTADGIRHINPREASVRENFLYLQGGIAPRPIALVSTLSATGARNLSPFSFFNAFGGNPPTVCISPSRRQRDGSVKDTYNNLAATRECVIQAVTYDMVQQVSLASTEYPTDVDEFIKSGLTPIPSEIVKPPRVAESPYQMECIVKEIIHLGDSNGSGNLIICEVVRYHIAERIFVNGIIHPDAIDLVGRNSADFYTRASGAAIFAVKKPLETRGIGFDQLPEYIRQSHVFTGNNLGQLGNCESIPSPEEITSFVQAMEPLPLSDSEIEQAQQTGNYRALFQTALQRQHHGDSSAPDLMERAAKIALDTANDTDFAWKAALYAETARHQLRHS